MDLFVLEMWWQIIAVLGKLLSCECEVTQQGIKEVDGHLHPMRNKRGMSDPTEKRLGCNLNSSR